MGEMADYYIEQMMFAELEKFLYVNMSEGALCPDCAKGTLTRSKSNKLYCSKMCWLDNITMSPIEGEF